MIKTPVKFQKDRSKTVGGVALTRYLLQTRNHAPRITHHAPRKAEYYVPSLFFFFRKGGGQQQFKTHGHPLGFTQHHWNTGANGNQQLIPGGPRNRHKKMRPKQTKRIVFKSGSSENLNPDTLAYKQRGKQSDWVSC